MPIGACYIQFHGMKGPSELFGGTWSNISEKFANCFFRCEGDKAVSFESENGETPIQPAGLPNITGYIKIEEQETSNNYLSNDSQTIGGGAFEVVLKAFGTKPFNTTDSSKTYKCAAEYNIDASRVSKVYNNTEEVIPYNTTIRIWKRTA